MFRYALLTSPKMPSATISPNVDLGDEERVYRKYCELKGLKVDSGILDSLTALRGRKVPAWYILSPEHAERLRDLGRFPLMVEDYSYLTELDITVDIVLNISKEKFDILITPEKNNTTKQTFKIPEDHHLFETYIKDMRSTYIEGGLYLPTSADDDDHLLCCLSGLTPVKTTKILGRGEVEEIVKPVTAVLRKPLDWIHLKHHARNSPHIMIL